MRRITAGIGILLLVGLGLAAGSAQAEGLLGGLSGKGAPAAPAPAAPPVPEAPPAAESPPVEPPADASSSSLRRPQPPTAPTGPSPTAPAPAPEPVEPPSVAAGSAHGFAGAWTGTYTCAQGLTGVSFAFEPPEGGEISAVVSFYAVPSNPGVPSGSFRVRGNQPGPKDQSLTMFPDGWIKRPPGYVMVGFDLQLSGDDMALRATLSGAAGCTTALLGRDG